MRTLVIGDIHGCHRSLVALEAAARITPADLVITLGDHIDRGPDSRGVVEWLIRRHATGRLTALRGDHELMLLAARDSASAHAEWLACGGDAVLASYGVRHVRELPRRHLEFLETGLVAHALAARHFCVHANAYPDVPIEEQPDFMLYWEDFGRPRPHESGLTMVCGHTPQHSGWPLDLGHAVCLDTGAGFGGWLTCLDLAHGFCWKANERGETREFWLGDRP
ncbi:MAG: metallophosphoesterase family protein [Planctomycetia bacterium]